MANYYNLDKVNAIAENDQEFVYVLVQTFLDEIPEDVSILTTAVKNKDHKATYQAAHKMKPTVELFGLNHYDTLIEIQDWGKFTQTDKNISEQLSTVLDSINGALTELKSDFNL